MPVTPVPFVVLLQPGCRVRLVTDLAPADADLTVAMWAAEGGPWIPGPPPGYAGTPRKTTAAAGKRRKPQGVF